MKRQKVLHIIFSLRTGGAETMLADIVNQQSKHAEVALLIVNDEIDSWVRQSVSPQIRVIELGRKPGSLPLALFWKLNRLILQMKPDAVHIHNHKLAALIRVRRKRMILTVHDVHVPMKYTGGVRMCAISEVVKEDILSRRPDAEVRVVKNGIRTGSITNRGDRAATVPFRIVQVARLEAHKKGQDILIKAVCILKRGGIDVELTFIGEGSDKKRLMRLAEDCGIGSSVKFAGQMTRGEIYSQLHDYDAMCHPARYEGFGLTVAEGAVAGLPLIVPDDGGTFEITAQGRYAETFHSGDATSCAEALKRVIENYPDALTRAAKAKRYVESNFSVESMAEKYMELYANRT